MLKIEILKDVEAEKKGVDLLVVKIEGEAHSHFEYGFIDEHEARQWIKEQDLSLLGF